jgi:hypothetical protein
MTPPRSQSTGRQSVPQFQSRNGIPERFRQGMLHIFKRPHGIDNGPTDIGFGNEERVGGNLQWPGVACRNDDVNGWPSVPYASSEFQSVHRAGHVDVRKDQMDVRAGFEYGDGRVGAEQRNAERRSPPANRSGLAQANGQAMGGQSLHLLPPPCRTRSDGDSTNEGGMIAVYREGLDVADRK